MVNARYGTIAVYMQVLQIFANLNNYSTVACMHVCVCKFRGPEYEGHTTQEGEEQIFLYIVAMQVYS